MKGRTPSLSDRTRSARVGTTSDLRFLEPQGEPWSLGEDSGWSLSPPVRFESCRRYRRERSTPVLPTTVDDESPGRLLPRGRLDTHGEYRESAPVRAPSVPRPLPVRHARLLLARLLVRCLGQVGDGLLVAVRPSALVVGRRGPVHSGPGKWRRTPGPVSPCEPSHPTSYVPRPPVPGKWTRVVAGPVSSRFYSLYLDRRVRDDPWSPQTSSNS